MKTQICELLNIHYPILQGGMAWIADGKLAAAVSEAGGLGIIAAGNASGEYVQEQIRIARSITDKPFGVNIMLLSPYVDEVAQIAADQKVSVVTTGAGNPGKYMKRWKEAGIIVIPVVASPALARMMERAGADAVIAEGGESGGHIGELSTMVLVPSVCDAVNIPVIAAGGIGDGRGAAAGFVLGASGIQMGTAFLCSEECNIHPVYKEKILKAGERCTMVTGRRSGHPVRSLKTSFPREFEKAEYSGVSQETLEQLGTGSLRKAVVEGDSENGSFLAGEIACRINEIRPAAEIIQSVMEEALKILEEAGRWEK